VLRAAKEVTANPKRGTNDNKASTANQATLQPQQSQQKTSQPTAATPPQSPAASPKPATVTSSDANAKVTNAFKNSGDLLNQLSQSATSKKDTSNKVQQAFNNSGFFKKMSGENK
jgi:hypothetical protein